MNREVLVDMIHLRKKLERAKDIKVSLAWLEEYKIVHKIAPCFSYGVECGRI